MNKNMHTIKVIVHVDKFIKENLYVKVSYFPSITKDRSCTCTEIRSLKNVRIQSALQRRQHSCEGQTRINQLEGVGGPL